VQFGAAIWILAPIVLTLTGAPALAGAQVAAGIVLFAIALAMHAVTLPVEFDASFARALPMLRDGGLVAERDLPDARRILRAAALTYVAAAVASVLNVLRWWRFGRF
jgi:Zn-dependent membrane protease YugP